jgi:hypothetical protein
MTFTEDNSCKAAVPAQDGNPFAASVLRSVLASEATWDRLQQAVHGRLLKGECSAACRTTPEEALST